MEATYHRHDISDKVWALLEPHLPGQRGQWDGIAQDNRRFINAVFWCCEQEPPGEIYRQITENGERSIRGLSGGAEKVSGKTCWKS